MIHAISYVYTLAHCNRREKETRLHRDRDVSDINICDLRFMSDPILDLDRINKKLMEQRLPRTNDQYVVRSPSSGKPRAAHACGGTYVFASLDFANCRIVVTEPDGTEHRRRADACSILTGDAKNTRRPPSGDKWEETSDPLVAFL